MNAKSFLPNTTTEGLKLDLTQVVATSNHNSVYRSDSARSSDRSAQWKVNAGMKTRQLLEGSIVLAKRASSNRRPTALTFWRWAYQLTDFYHLCHPTPQLMQEAAQRFASDGRCSLAQWASIKASEEKGHDGLALIDLQSMGFDADALVKAVRSPAAARLVNFFRKSVQAPDPIGCIGHCYTMERLALGIGQHHIQKIEAMLTPTHATRCLRVHSSVGSDVKHVEETIDLVSQLAFEEQNDVAKACYEIALLCFSPPRERSEEELQNLLRPFKSTKNRN